MQTSLTDIRQSVTDIRQKWSNAKPTKAMTFWIAIGAIVLTLILGFTRGGWTTAATATTMAESSAQNAVIARLAPICVAQFNADSQQTGKLEELKALGSFQRATFVQEQGWATMPGETEPDNRVARECASQLMLIDE